MNARAILLSLIMAVAFSGPALARCADYVPQPKPQNASRDIVGADLDTIVGRGYITFAAYEDFPPWFFDEGGQIKGVDIDIARLIAGDLGVEPRCQLVAAGENLQADLRNWVWKGPIVGGRVANVMLHIPYDSEFACRVEQVVFTGRYHEEEVAVHMAYRALGYAVDEAIYAAMQDGRMDEIFTRYGLTHVVPKYR